MKFILSGTLTFVIMFAMSFAIADPQQAHGTRMAGIIAAIVIAAIPIYSLDRFALWQRSVAHLLVMVLTIIPSLMWSGWFDWRTVPGFLALIGTFVGFGFAGWSIGYLISKSVDRRKGAANSE